MCNTDFVEIYDEVGMVDQDLVVVIFTEPEDDLVPIVSARLATRPEWDLFEVWERERERERDE